LCSPPSSTLFPYTTLFRSLHFSILLLFWCYTYIVSADLALAFPSVRQLKWQQREVEALIHFGINTFTGREWGGGNEDPAIFNPRSEEHTSELQSRENLVCR